VDLECALSFQGDQCPRVRRPRSEGFEGPDHGGVALGFSLGYELSESVKPAVPERKVADVIRN